MQIANVVWHLCEVLFISRDSLMVTQVMAWLQVGAPQHRRRSCSPALNPHLRLLFVP